MDREFLTDEDIHGCKEDSEVTILKNKMDKLEEKLEEAQDKIKTIKEKLEHDIKVNERCLKEELKDKDFIRMLELWIKFDKALLDIVSEE